MDIYSIGDVEAVREALSIRAEEALSAYYRENGIDGRPPAFVRELWIESYIKAYNAATHEIVKGNNVLALAVDAYIQSKPAPKPVHKCGFCGNPDPEMECGCVF